MKGDIMGLFSNKYSSFNNSINSIVGKIIFDNNNYVPQGVCYAEGYYFLTMYDYSKKDNSILFIYKNGDVFKKLTLDNKTHGGGISFDYISNCIFITGIGENNHSYIYKYELSYLLSEHNDGFVKTKFKYEVDYDNSLYSSAAKHSSPSYLTCFDGYIYVGNYCSCEDLDRCIIKKFKILSDGSLSKSFDLIKNPFSNTQGICVFEYNNEILYLFSRSFGRKRNSLIHVCKLENGTFCIISTMVLPSMLEQVSIAEDKLVLIFESGSKIFSKSVLNVNDDIFLINLDRVLNSKDKYGTFCKGTSFFTRNTRYKY